MVKIACTFSLFGIALLLAANARVAYPQGFIVGFMCIGACILTGIFAVASFCEWLSELGEERSSENNYTRGGFDRIHRENYRVAQMEIRAKEHGIHRHIWM